MAECQLSEDELLSENLLSFIGDEDEDKDAEQLDIKIQQLKDKNANSNTEKSTRSWGKRFEDWVAKWQFTIHLEFVSTEGLNKVLERFFTELRKQDGTNYESDSLQTMLAVLDGYFHMDNCPFSVLKDDTFAEARKVLKGKAIELREKGWERENGKQTL